MTSIARTIMLPDTTKSKRTTTALAGAWRIWYDRPSPKRPNSPDVLRPNGPHEAGPGSYHRLPTQATGDAGRWDQDEEGKRSPGSGHQGLVGQGAAEGGSANID